MSKKVVLTPLLSHSIIERGCVISDRYSSHISSIDLDNATWARFLRLVNRNNKYLPWYDAIFADIDTKEPGLQDDDTIIKIDGPNYEDEDKGVLLQASTFEDCYSHERVTSVVLCWLDEARSRSKLIKTTAADDTIYKSGKIVNEELDCCSLARKRLFALATRSTEDHQHMINVCEYILDHESYKERIPDVKRIASLENIPHFKKLCWIYGHNLLGLTPDKKLYILGVDYILDVDHNLVVDSGKITIHQQHIPLEIDDIAVHFPDNPHEILLLAKQKIYYANLARRNKKGALLYRCIYPDRNISLADSIQGSADRIWFFDKEITVARMPDPTLLKDPNRICNFMELEVKYPLLQKVIDYVEKKPKSTRKNRFLRDENSSKKSNSLPEHENGSNETNSIKEQFKYRLMLANKVLLHK